MPAIMLSDVDAALEALALLQTPLLDGTIKPDAVTSYRKIDWTKIYSRMGDCSFGEKTVIRFALDMYNGMGECKVHDVMLLDPPLRRSVLDILCCRAEAFD